jgi:Leucine-rich repeat (LRR) protein
MRYVVGWLMILASAFGCSQSSTQAQESTAPGEQPDADSSVSDGPRVCSQVMLQDPSLEYFARLALGVDAGPLDPVAVAQLTRLQAVNVGSFWGIECFTGLKELYANLGWAMEADPVGALTQLEILSLDRHSFYTIAPLGSLSRLRELSLRESLGLASADPIRNLVELETLDLSDNSIYAWHAIAPLSRLKTLSINHARAGDLAFLAGHASLETLEAEDNEIADLSPLAGLDIATLKLGRNRLQAVGALATLTKLKHVDLARNSVTDLTPLASAGSLETLILDSNPIQDVSPLAALTTLTTLSLADTAVADVSPLQPLMPRLQYFVLRGTRVTDIAPLAQGSTPRTVCSSIDLRAATLDSRSLSVSIPKLCADRWRVDWNDAAEIKTCVDQELCPPLGN